MKYFDAILSGAWVLSPGWIFASCAVGRWLPEADFEVSGDHVATGGPAAGRRHGPQLFAGLRLHFPRDGEPSKALETSKRKEKERLSLFAGCSRPTFDDDTPKPRQSELEYLARRGGAEVLTSIQPAVDVQANPPHLSGEAAMPSAGADGGSREPLASPSGPWWHRPVAVVASGGSTGASCPAASRVGWLVLPSSWMLDCISHGQIIAPPLECLGSFFRPCETRTPRGRRQEADQLRDTTTPSEAGVLRTPAKATEGPAAWSRQQNKGRMGRGTKRRSEVIDDAGHERARSRQSGPCELSRPWKALGSILEVPSSYA